MEIIVALVGLAIAVLVAAYVAQPLMTGTRLKLSAQESPRDKLLAERDALYAAIRDLDFDFQTGKLLEVDYRAMRDKYTARGVEVLKELDAMLDAGRQPEVGGRRSAATDEIEAAVQARRRTRTQAAVHREQEDEIEAAIRARRKVAARAEKSEGKSQVCPSCGRPIDPTDRFCAKCGASLTVEATR